MPTPIGDVFAYGLKLINEDELERVFWLLGERINESPRPGELSHCATTS
jgi:hypothetical protein